MPSINWSDLASQEEESRKPAPAGTYTLVVKSGKWKETKEEGWPMLALTCQISSGKYAGKPMWQNLTFNTDKMMTITMARLFIEKVWGDFNEWANLRREVQESSMDGCEFEAEVKVRQYMGRDQNEIDKVIRGVRGPGGQSAPGGMTPPPLEKDGSTTDSEAPKNPLEK